MRRLLSRAGLCAVVCLLLVTSAQADSVLDQAFDPGDERSGSRGQADLGPDVRAGIERPTGPDRGVRQPRGRTLLSVNSSPTWEGQPPSC